MCFAAEAGQLQLNAFEPVIVRALFESLTHMRAACLTLAGRCVRGITANPEHLRDAVERSIGIATALTPLIGHEVATRVAREALSTGRTVHELVLSEGLLTEVQVEDALRPQTLADPRSPWPPTPRSTQDRERA